MSKKNFFVILLIIIFLIFQFQDYSSCNTNNSTLNIPSTIGKITDSFETKSNEKIIIIQDLHCNKNTQISIYKNIKIIKNLYKNKCNIIGVEGSPAKKINPILPQKNKKLTINYLLKNGKITGAEIYKIKNPKKIELVGIEDISIYLQNFYEFCFNINTMPEIQIIIENLSAEIKNQKTKYLTQELKNWEYIYNKYKNNIYNNNFLEHLEKHIQNYHIKTDETYPNITKLILIKNKEKLTSKTLAIQELSSLVKSIYPYLSSIEFKNLSKLEQYSDEYFMYIFSLINKFNINIKKYKNLSMYFYILLQYKNINTIDIYNEIESINYKIKTSIIKKQTPLLRHIIFCENYLNLTKKYISLKTNHSQIEYILNYQLIFFNHLKSTTKATPNLKEQIETLETLIEKYNKFYLTANKRNEFFVKNILSIKNSPVKIMIVGGYHTKGITNILRTKNISYTVIAPNFNFNNAKKYNDLYFKIMKDQLGILDKKTNIYSQNYIAPISPFVTGTIIRDLSKFKHLSLKSKINIKDKWDLWGIILYPISFIISSIILLTTYSITSPIVIITLALSLLCASWYLLFFSTPLKKITYIRNLPKIAAMLTCIIGISLGATGIITVSGLIYTLSSFIVAFLVIIKREDMNKDLAKISPYLYLVLSLSTLIAGLAYGILNPTVITMFISAAILALIWHNYTYNSNKPFVKFIPRAVTTILMITLSIFSISLDTYTFPDDESYLLNSISRICPVISSLQYTQNNIEITNKYIKKQKLLNPNKNVLATPPISDLHKTTFNNNNNYNIKYSTGTYSNFIDIFYNFKNITTPTIKQNNKLDRYNKYKNLLKKKFGEKFKIIIKIIFFIYTNTTKFFTPSSILLKNLMKYFRDNILD